MGNDGGSIPKRRELVKESSIRKKTTTDLKESQHEQQSHKWSTCPLSHRKLAQPVVSDSLGRLFNKDAVLEYLLSSESNSAGVSRADQEDIVDGRIKSLKDVVQLHFEVDSSEKDSSTDDRWICPVSSKELNANVKAVYLVPCGHVFAEAAIKEVAGTQCVRCDSSYETGNIIPILPVSKSEIERLEARNLRLKEDGLTHSLKKGEKSGKKRKKNGETTSEAKKAAAPNGSGIKNAATANLTAKVLEDERNSKKQRKEGMNSNIQSLFTKDGEKIRDGDFMTRGFSISAGGKR